MEGLGCSVSLQMHGLLALYPASPTLQKALTIKSAIPHPRIMGVIRECGGKMHMQQRAWNEAATDFFEVRARPPPPPPPAAIHTQPTATHTHTSSPPVSHPLVPLVGRC